MKYLCLIHADESKLAAMPPAEVEALSRACEAHCRELRQQGVLLDARRLAPAHTAACVRVRRGEVMVTTGPFAETAEQLGGFFLVEARDMNEAIRIASTIGAAGLGTVEVRAVD